MHDFQQCVVVLLGDCYGGNTLSEISVKFLAVKFLELQVLPDNLMGSLTQAAEATTYALTKGIERSTVAILLPEFWDPMSGLFLWVRYSFASLDRRLVLVTSVSY